MLTFPLSPGVFVDEPEFVSFSASRADTAVPAFVTGPAAEQPWWAAAGQPVIIRSFAEYEQAVRGPVRSRRGLAGSRYLPGSPALRPGRGPARWPTLVAASGAEAGTDIDWSRPLAPALKAFFGNGGGWCYLCPRDKLAAVADLPDVTLVVQAGEAGTEGDILALCQPGSGLFALLDGPQHEGMFSAGALEAHLATLSPSESAALYYPWLRASWPVRDGSGQRVEDIHLVSPGAVAAGLLCQTDRVTGPWKAPSNLPVSAGLTPVVRVGDNAQARFTSMDFTAMSVNMFRSFSVPGVRLWGARALTAGGSAWGYIQVRRTFDMVERDLQRALAAALFEPNGPETWRLLRATADNYLHTLMQQGAFAGSTAAECYRVEAGLGVTMSEADVRAGTLRMRIGLAVVRPAEFVVLEFSQQRDADDGAGGLPVVVPVTLTSPAKGASFNTEYIPTYSGRGTYKATVTIEQRATGAHSWDTVGTAKVDRNGNWSLAGGTLSAGEREARALQSSDDSVSESNTFTVTQAVTLTSPAKGASFDITHAPTYRGRGAPGATVTIEQRTTADLSWDTVGTATVDSEGNWSLAGGTLSASEREARASQSSDASVSESNTFTVTQAVTLTSPAKGESFDITHALTYRGRGAPGATVTIHQGLISSSWSTMGTATVASDGNWSLAGGTLGAGKREAKASQSSDGSSSKSNTFTVTQAVTLTSPAKGASFNTEHAPTYSGRGAPGATVTIQQKTTADPSWNTVGTKTVDRDGNWSLAGGTLSAGEREARASQSSDASVSESNTFTVTQAVREYVRAEQQLPAFTTGMLNKMGGSLAMDHDGRALAVSGDRSSKSEVCVYQKSGAIWSEFKRHNVSPGYEGRVLVMDSTGENFAVGIRLRWGGTTVLYNNNSNREQVFWHTGGGKDVPEQIKFGHRMGTSLAINSAGTLVASGADSGEESGKKGGSVVMFHQINGEWAVPDINEVIHLGEAAAENDRFGSALAMNGAGSLLVVSAPGRRDGKGEVITFTWQNDSWQRSDEPAPGDATLFGTRLSMNEAGTLLAVSGTTANDDGAVYLFSRQQDGWQLVQTITLPAETAPGFGYDVALSGDGGTLCVSSPTATNAESAVTGCVWIYKNPASEWQLMQQLFAPDAAAGHRYGEAIAVNHAGTLLAVGVPGAPGTTAGETGKVWLYEEQIT